MKLWRILSVIFLPYFGIAQEINTNKYCIRADKSKANDAYFKADPVWLGADGAASIDMENGKVLWLFSDGFICNDKSGLRTKSKMIRNSIAIQSTYELNNSTLKYYWGPSIKEPSPFFYKSDKFWFWTGHGIMLKDKLAVFLMKMEPSDKGLGFIATGWYVALISNPYDEPSRWKIKYIKGPDTFGLIAGSAAVLKDKKYIYAFGAVEPSTHEIYVLRWKMEDAYAGNFSEAEWGLDGKWGSRKKKEPVPKPLFIGGTEFSVHYDSTIRKYIQIQSFGFGKAKIGLRMADSLLGPWTQAHEFFMPDYSEFNKPFMYSAKAHPELKTDGVYITYNINSFDFKELLEDKNIYFPKFIRLKILKK